MNPQELDRRITFKIASYGSKDGYGHSAVTYTDLTVWAKVSFVSDGERLRAQSGMSQITHRFLIRHSDQVEDIDAKSRIVFDGLTYEIIGAPKEIGRRKGLEFSAVAVADG
jgi:SPP1 family predicted phage head-tail adaptor